MGYFVGLENKKVEIIGYVERIKGLFDDVFICLKWDNFGIKKNNNCIGLKYMIYILKICEFIMMFFLFREIMNLGINS